MSETKYIASVSFGKDSLAMLLLILKKGLPLHEVIFYDTGMEFQAIYSIRDRILPILEEHGVKYTELHPPRPFMFDMLEKPVNSKKNGLHYGYSWCGGCARWGTATKTAALNSHARKAGKNVVQYVGIAADEEKNAFRNGDTTSTVASATTFRKYTTTMRRKNARRWSDGTTDI